MDPKDSNQAFFDEDQPCYRRVAIFPYLYKDGSIEVCLRSIPSEDKSETLQSFQGHINEKEPSIIYTIASTLIYQSHSFFPNERSDELLDRKSTSMPLFYYNPLVNKVIETVTRNPKCVVCIEDDLWVVWYPIQTQFDLEEVNAKLEIYKTKLARVKIAEDEQVANGPIEAETLQLLQKHLPRLLSKLNNCELKLADHCVILDNHSKIWKQQYEALLVGQFTTIAEEQWMFCNSQENELPSADELKNLKVIFLPGSFTGSLNYQIYSHLVDFLRTVIDNYPHIKLCGIGSGSLILAKTLGSDINEGGQLRFMGKEQIQLSENFFQQKWVQKCMNDHSYTRKTFPQLVLQQCYSQTVQQLSQGCQLLGSSEQAGTQIFSYQSNVLGVLSHPEYNCAFLQELASQEYLKLRHITYEFYEQAYLQCQDNLYGIETRNLMLSLMREWINDRD